MRGTCIDVTDRVLAEQARERSRGALPQPGGVEPRRDPGPGRSRHGRPGQRPRPPAARRRPRRHELRDHPSAAADRRPTAPSRPGRRRTGADARRDRPPRLPRRGRATTRSRSSCTTRPRGWRTRRWPRRLREAQVRRRQALEINDNVVQGLTAALVRAGAGDDRAGHRLPRAHPVLGAPHDERPARAARRRGRSGRAPRAQLASVLRRPRRGDAAPRAAASRASAGPRGRRLRRPAHCSARSWSPCGSARSSARPPTGRQAVRAGQASCSPTWCCSTWRCRGWTGSRRCR